MKSLYSPEFATKTGSEWGMGVLRDFPMYISKFWLPKPRTSTIEILIESIEQAA